MVEAIQNLHEKIQDENKELFEKHVSNNDDLFADFKHIIDQNRNQLVKAEQKRFQYYFEIIKKSLEDKKFEKTSIQKSKNIQDDLQAKIKEQAQIKLLSFSVTPQIDSVAQLKKYALEKGVMDAYWNLLTGDKKEIYELARKSYLAVKEDGDGGPFDMIHTENFILVDPDRRIRGFYDGTDSDVMDNLIQDIKILKKEESN